MNLEGIAKEVMDKYLGQIQDLDIDRVKECNINSQSRADDVNIEHVQKLMASIAAVGQQEPIIVQQHQSGEFQPIDGNGRLKAMKQLGRDTIKARVFSRVLSVGERVSVQLNRNNHKPTDPNKRKDIIKAINDLLATGFFKNINDNQLLSEEIDDWYKETMPGAPKKKRHKIIQAALNSRSTPSSIRTFKTYTMKDAVEFINNNTSFTGKQGEIENQEVFYLLGNISSLRAQLGSMTTMKRRNPNVKVTLFIWDQNTVGKNDAQIQKYRNSTRDRIIAENGAWFYVPDFSLVDELFYLPQLKGTESLSKITKMTL